MTRTDPTILTSDPTILTSWDHPIMLPTSPRPLESTSSSSHIHNQSTHSTSSHLHNQTQIQILTHLTQDPTQLTQDPTPTHVLIRRSNPTKTHVVVGKHHQSHVDDNDPSDMDDTEPDVNDDIDKTHHLTIPRYRSRSFSSASSSSSSSSSPPHRDLSPSPRAHQRDDWSHHISSPTHSNLSSQHASSTTSVAVSSSPSPSASPSSFSSRSPSHMISSRRISSLSSSSSHMSSPHSYTSSPLRRHRQLHPISPDILSPCALELGIIAMHHVRPHFPHSPSEPNSPLLENRIISCSAPSSTLIKSRLLSTSSSTTSSSSTSVSTPASPSHASSSPLSLKPRYLHSPQQSHSAVAMKQRSNSWSSIASTYAQFFHEYFTRFAEIAMHMVMERSPWSPDAYILDVGAGTGALSLTTARHGYRTCAIDYSPDMIHILNSKRTQQHLSEAILHSVIMDAQAMGFPDSRFDVVFAMFCVMLFPSKTIGLTEMYRVLKPGGYMVMTLWDDEYATEWNVLHTQAMRLVRPDRGFDMITHSHDRDATVALIQSIGFTNVEMTPGVSLTYTVEDPTSFWHALAQVTSTRFLLDTYFTKQQQQRVQHTFISLLQQRGDPETGVIKLTGRATFYIVQKPMNATSTATSTATVVNDGSSVIASSSTPSSSISLVTIPSPVPSLYPPTCVSPPISISSSSSSCSSDSPSSSFKLPPPVTSTSPAMSCNSSTSSSMEQDTSTS